MSSSCNIDPNRETVKILLIMVLLAIAINFLFASCGTIKYVPVETVKTEYVNKTDTFIQKDSVFCRDSIYVEKNGDTITVNKVRYVYKDKWKEVVKIDSFIKTDSVQVPYPVEKNLSRWEKLKMDAGGIALGACLLFIILIIVSWLRRRNR